MNEYDILEFCADVMRTKGYDPTGNVDVGDIFLLQKEGWIREFKKYRLDESPERRRDVLSGFAARQVIGGAGKILEAFTAYLASRASQDSPGPDWQRAARDRSECPYCENRGIVSNIPVASANGAFQGVREYSFACVCDNAIRFAGARKAEEWMLQYAVIRKGKEAERLRQWRRDNDLDAETFSEFAPKFREWMKRQGGSGTIFVKVSDPKPERTIDTRVLAEVRPSRKLDAPKKESQWTTADEEALSEF